MKQQTLASLVHAPLDADYVGNFQALAAVNLELERHGPSHRRLLRKGILELDVGNFEAGHETLHQALRYDDSDAETHFQHAVASLLVACVKADAIVAAPGSNIQQDGRTIVEHLRSAAKSLAAVVRLNPHDDEAKEGLGHLAEVMADDPDDAALRNLLQDLRLDEARDA